MSAVSPDGLFFAGSSYEVSRFGTIAAGEAFLGAVGTGSKSGIGDLSGGANFSEASAVADGGTAAVGVSVGINGSEAFRWTPSGGITGLGMLPTAVLSSNANDISADGNTVVGVSSGGGIFDDEAFRWTPTDGMVGLGDLPGGVESSIAHAVSADGTTVVGYGYSANPETANGDVQAFRWTAEDGMVGLGDLPGGVFGSVARDVSSDGQVVVGSSSSSIGDTNSNRTEAFRWTSLGGMEGLGHLAGGEPHSFARAVSADGAVVVGYSGVSPDYEAFIWDSAHGMRSVRTWLSDAGLGVALAGWRLTHAFGISADGNVIVGSGINPSGMTEGWIATLSFLGPDGDYNDSGVVEQGDLDLVLANWGAAFDAIPTAWINQRPTSGIVDQAELDGVLTNWGASAAPDFGGASVPEPTAAGVIVAAGLRARSRMRASSIAAG